jgi:hypothetical protein
LKLHVFAAIAMGKHVAPRIMPLSAKGLFFAVRNSEHKGEKATRFT